MSIVESEKINLNKICAKCLGKCKGCRCGAVRRLMRRAEDLERNGQLTKEDKKEYMSIMRG